MAKSEFGDDVEKTTVLGLKDLELLAPDKNARSAYFIVINGRAVGKMFKLAGPVIVYGTFAAFVIGIIHLIFQSVGG